MARRLLYVHGARGGAEGASAPPPLLGLDEEPRDAFALVKEPGVGGVEGANPEPVVWRTLIRLVNQPVLHRDGQGPVTSQADERVGDLPPSLGFDTCVGHHDGHRLVWLHEVEERHESFIVDFIHCRRFEFSKQLRVRGSVVRAANVLGRVDLNIQTGKTEEKTLLELWLAHVCDRVRLR